MGDGERVVGVWEICGLAVALRVGERVSVGVAVTLTVGVGVKVALGVIVAFRVGVADGVRVGVISPYSETFVLIVSV